MARTSKIGYDKYWADDYWVLVIQLYLQKPVGYKPLYSRHEVETCIEFNINPILFNKNLKKMDVARTPHLNKLLSHYQENPKKLSKDIKRLQQMIGFNKAGIFYEGVETNNYIKTLFSPISDGEKTTPVMLIIILSLYFELTPATMVAETPEIKDISRMMKINVDDVVKILNVYQHCDPFLNLNDEIASTLKDECQKIWDYYSDDIERLDVYANNLSHYFRAE